MITRRRLLLVGILGLCFVFSCAPSRGEFAFKKNIDDSYKKVRVPLEFSTDERMKWVYSFPVLKKNRNLGVVVLKKELVWVDIESRSELLTPVNKVIYGSLEDYREGTYRIIITEKNKKLDEIEFQLYRETDDLSYR